MQLAGEACAARCLPNKIAGVLTLQTVALVPGFNAEQPHIKGAARFLGIDEGFLKISYRLVLFKTEILTALTLMLLMTYMLLQAICTRPSSPGTKLMLL